MRGSLSIDHIPGKSGISNECCMAKPGLFLLGGQAMFAYCLQCQTQRCRIIAELLEKRGANRAFSPQIISRQRKQGKNEDHQSDLIPGYVFVYMEQQLTDYQFFKNISSYQTDSLLFQSNNTNPWRRKWNS